MGMTEDLVVTYRPAVAEDEAELRALLHRTPLPGPIRLSMRKEPDFFSAMAVEGERTDVLLAQDDADGRIVGVGARSEKPCFINGAKAPVTVGYLSNLRIEAPYRGGKILKAGYQQMERMHREGKAGIYTTTILEGNIPAIKALTSGRPGLPLYRDFGPYHSFMLSARALPVKADGPIETFDAAPDDIDELVRFWHVEGRRRQFFPAYRAEHLAGGSDPSSPSSCGAATLAAATPVQGAPLRSGSSTAAVSSSPPSCGAGLLSGLRIADIAVARDCRGVAGTAALWDQTAFRQWFVEGYSGALGIVRPAFNLVARMLRRPTLPRPQSAFAYRFLALVCVRDDRPDVLRALLAHLGRRCRGERFSGLVVAGCAGGDPLRPVLAAMPHVLMKSRIYVVHWDDGLSAYDALDKRLVPYLEVGSL